LLLLRLFAIISHRNKAAGGWHDMGEGSAATASTDSFLYLLYFSDAISAKIAHPPFPYAIVLVRLSIFSIAEIACSNSNPTGPCCKYFAPYVYIMCRLLDKYKYTASAWLKTKTPQKQTIYFTNCNSSSPNSILLLKVLCFGGVKALLLLPLPLVLDNDDPQQSTRSGSICCNKPASSSCNLHCMRKSF
jgi:hypothetical protein